VPCGTTGESATLSDKEHRRVIELCVEAANGRVPVIAGAGSNETTVSIAYAKKAKAVGADAALVVTPNIPGRSIVDITNDTMGKLAKLPTVIGCKDATGDITRVAGLIERCGEDFIQLSGDDPSSLGHAAHGGRGCISVGSNIAPAIYAEFHNLMLAKDFVGAQRINQKLHRLHQDLFLDPSPAPTKYALNLMGKMDTPRPV